MTDWRITERGCSPRLDAGTPRFLNEGLAAVA